ncbi:MAG: methylmalonyl-CoA mutase family protein, partial [Thermoleophilaceae bacterium]
VNQHIDTDEPQTELHKMTPGLEQKQIGRLQAARARRDSQHVETTLTQLRQAAASQQNLMDPLLDCARAHCTVGEIIQSLQQVFGTYTETPVF